MTQVPRTLDAWLDALDAVVLPAAAAPYARVQRALRDSSLSLRQIAELIQTSPALALVVIREANRGAAASSKPAESLEVALSRIGLKRAAHHDRNRGVGDVVEEGVAGEHDTLGADRISRVAFA